jgi:hypothetical protein
MVYKARNCRLTADGIIAHFCLLNLQDNKIEYKIVAFFFLVIIFFFSYYFFFFLVIYSVQGRKIKQFISL